MTRTLNDIRKKVKKCFPDLYTEYETILHKSKTGKKQSTERLPQSEILKIQTKVNNTLRKQFLSKTQNIKE